MFRQQPSLYKSSSFFFSSTWSSGTKVRFESRNKFCCRCDTVFAVLGSNFTEEKVASKSFTFQFFLFISLSFAHVMYALCFGCRDLKRFPHQSVTSYRHDPLRNQCIYGLSCRQVPHYSQRKQTITHSSTSASTIEMLKIAKKTWSNYTTHQITSFHQIRRQTLFPR